MKWTIQTIPYYTKKRNWHFTAIGKWWGLKSSMKCFLTVRNNLNFIPLYWKWMKIF